MPLYLDSSCFLKLFFTEAESDHVIELIKFESRVIISTITELETMVQLHGLHRGGTIRKKKLLNLLGTLEELKGVDPF